MPRPARPAIDRIYARIKVNPFGCWEFQGAIKGNGYGVIQLGRGVGVELAHRHAWESEHGPIPEGMTIDHLCYNTRCVNTAHMEVVSRAENARRQWAAGRANPMKANLAKTHCPRGHEYTPGNTHVYNGHRSCRTCSRERARAIRLGKAA